MNYSAIKEFDVADGPGVRVSLFVSGCTHHCPGCFNASTWDFDSGEPYTEEVQESILKAMSPEHIQGITVLGGEPFEPENRFCVLELIKEVRSRFPEKDVWCYSGYTFEEMLKWIDEGRTEVRELLENIDILVDGEFVMAKKDITLQFRGSSNQRILKASESVKAGKPIFWEELKK
ncbi:MAG: anaerobic ribonucleoside-triphosphate reductase activating protein [Acetatifactor sp.]|nr:anaerobic ribonucleoside-triphosphate reductase activating protein [Acetatifactor sp.]